MPFTRERLIGVVVAVLLGCGAFVFGLRWLESMMAFRPDRMTDAERNYTPEGAESVWFNSADGTRLHGWFFESQTGPETATGFAQKVDLSLRSRRRHKAWGVSPRLIARCFVTARARERQNE